MRLRDYAVAMAAYNAWMTTSCTLSARRCRTTSASASAARSSPRSTVRSTICCSVTRPGCSASQAKRSACAHPRKSCSPTSTRCAARAAGWMAVSPTGLLRCQTMPATRRSASSALRTTSSAHCPAGPIVHFFNHQTHHRGQLTTLLSQLGIDPGVTDFPWMPFFDFDSDGPDQRIGRGRPTGGP